MLLDKKTGKYFKNSVVFSDVAVLTFFIACDIIIIIKNISQAVLRQNGEIYGLLL